MNIPNFNTFALKYIASDEVAIGNRVFHIKILVKSDINSWPMYGIFDETDDSQAGAVQRKTIGPLRRTLMQEVMKAIRAAGWSVDTNTYVFEAPMSHLSSALTTIQTGNWT